MVKLSAENSEIMQMSELVLQLEADLGILWGILCTLGIYMHKILCTFGIYSQTFSKLLLSPYSSLRRCAHTNTLKASSTIFVLHSMLVWCRQTYLVLARSGNSILLCLYKYTGYATQTPR